MTCGDGGDKTTVAGLIHACAGRPGAEGTPRRLRWLTGQGDGLAPRLHAAGGRRPWARGVLETLVHSPAGAFEPAATPAPDRGACRAEAACRGGGREAIRQQENHLCPATQVLGRGVGTDHRVQRLAFLLQEWHSGRWGSRQSRLLYSAGRMV